MAKATANNVKEKYILELSKDEAQTLLDVVRHIGGSSSTRRKHTNAISFALGETGSLLLCESTGRYRADDLGYMYFKG